MTREKVCCILLTQKHIWGGVSGACLVGRCSPIRNAGVKTTVMRPLAKRNPTGALQSLRQIYAGAVCPLCFLFIWFHNCNLTSELHFLDSVNSEHIFHWSARYSFPQSGPSPSASLLLFLFSESTSASLRPVCLLSFLFCRIEFSQWYLHRTYKIETSE